jgi:hypothetical protein
VAAVPHPGEMPWNFKILFQNKLYGTLFSIYLVLNRLYETSVAKITGGRPNP